MTILPVRLAFGLLAIPACSNERVADVPPATSQAPTDGSTVSASLAGLQVPDSWGLASSSGRGPAELIRYRERGDGVREAGLHTYRVCFSRPFGEHPSEAETRRADELEDELCTLLEPGNQALLWLVRTGGGKRIWVFYAASTDEAASRLRRASELVATRGATMDVDRDPEWSMYLEFTPR